MFRTLPELRYRTRFVWAAKIAISGEKRDAGLDFSLLGLPACVLAVIASICNCDVLLLWSRPRVVLEFSCARCACSSPLVFRLYGSFSPGPGLLCCCHSMLCVCRELVVEKIRTVAHSIKSSGFGAGYIWYGGRYMGEMGAGCWMC